MDIPTKAIKSTAEFSKCRQFRYTLIRDFQKGKGTLTFILLNPSTANEEFNDPTIARCENRTIAMGFKRMVITNIYPFRATNPKEMFAAKNARGEKSKIKSLIYKNNEAILDHAKRSKLVICAWGCHSQSESTSNEVKEILDEHKVKLHVLELSKNGRPKHPLYLRNDLEPRLWG